MNKKPVDFFAAAQQNPAQRCEADSTEPQPSPAPGRFDVQALVDSINKRNAQARQPQQKQKQKSRQALSAALSKIMSE